MHQKKAASVLPLPVGAVNSVWRPAATSRQPRSWTSVGAAKAARNHSRAGAEKRSKAGFMWSPLNMPLGRFFRRRRNGVHRLLWRRRPPGEEVALLAPGAEAGAGR